MVMKSKCLLFYHHIEISIYQNIISPECPWAVFFDICVTYNCDQKAIL